MASGPLKLQSLSHETSEVKLINSVVIKREHNHWKKVLVVQTGFAAIKLICTPNILFTTFMCAI